MTRHLSLRLSGAIVALGMLLTLAAQPAAAAVLTWDGDTAAAGVQDAPNPSPGTWTNGDAHWYSSTGSQGWSNTNPDTATFGSGTAASNPYAVNLGSNITAAGITFANQVYTIGPDAGNLYALTVNASGITANVSATINAPVLLGATQSWTVAAGKTLGIGGVVTNTNGAYTLTVLGGGTLQVGSGGVINTSGLIAVGDTSNPTLSITGGAVTGSMGTTAFLGNTASKPGMFFMSSGSLTLYAGTAYFTNNAAGTWTQTGGVATINVTSPTLLLYCGTTGTAAVATFNLSGGSFTVVGGAGLNMAYKANTTITMSNSASVNIPIINMGSSSATTTGSFNLNGGTLTSNQVVFKTNTGIFNFNGGTLRAGAYSTDFMPKQSGTATLSVLSGGAIIDTNGYNIAITQPLAQGAASTGGLTKVGLGNLILSSLTNSYTGTTTVSTGNLYVNGSLAATSPVSVASFATLGGSGTVTNVTNNGGTIEGGFNQSGNLTVTSLTFTTTGTIAGALSAAGPAVSAGTLTTAGSGSVLINVVGSLSGLTSGNTYHLLQYGSQVGAEGVAAFQLATPYRFLTLSTAPGTPNYVDLTYNNSGGTLYPIWTGSNGTAFSGGNNWKLSGTGGAATDYMRLDDIHFDDSAGTGTVNFNVNAYPNATTITNTSLNYTWTGTGGITNGTVTKSGTGTLTINNVNSFGGGLVVNGGLVQINAQQRFTGNVTINNGTVQIGTPTALGVNLGLANGTAVSNVVIFGPGTSTGKLQLNGNNVTLPYVATDATTPGTATIENANVTPATLTLVPAASQTYAGVLQDGAGGGALALTFSGNQASSNTASAYMLTGSNTYTGLTTVQRNFLTLANPAGQCVQGNLYIASNPTNAYTGVIMGGTNQLSGNTVISFSAASSLTYAVQLNGFNQQAAGLVDTSTYGMVTGRFSGTTGSATLTIGGAGGNYSFNGYFYEYSTTSPIALTKTGTGTQVLSNSGNLFYSGPTTIQGGALQMLPIASTAKTNFVLNGGVLQQASNGPYAFTLNLGSGSKAIQWASVAGSGTLGGGFGANGGVMTVQLNGSGTLSTPLVWGSTSSFIPTGGTLIFNADSSSNNMVDFQNYINLNGGVRTVNVSAGSSGTASAKLSGVISDTIGGGGLTKTGAGDLYLTLANTYTGTTTVANGRLSVLGSLAATGSVSVSGGAILSGSGSVGTTSVSGGGSLEAGYGGSGSLTLAGLNFLGAATLSASGVSNYINAGTAPFIVTGTNTLGTSPSSITINLSGNAPIGSGTMHLIQYNGTIQGSGSSSFTLGSRPTPGVRATFYSLADNPGSPGYLNLNYVSDYPYWTGLGDGTWVVGSQSPQNWRLSSDNSSAYFLAGDNVLFGNQATGTSVSIAAANVSPATVRVTSDTKNFTISGPFGITGTATTLSKSGNSTLTLSASNDYGGGTTLAAGTLRIGIDSQGAPGTIVSSAAGTGVLNLNGGTLSSDGTAARSIYNYLSVAGSTTLGDAGNYGPLTFSGSGTLPVQSQLTIRSPVTMNNALSGTGGFTKAGTATLTLGGASTYSGTTTLSEGVVAFSAANNFGNSTIAFSGGTLQWAPGNTADVSGRFAAFPTGGTAFVDTGTNNVTFGGALSGSGGMMKLGTGILTINRVNNNALYGNVTVSAGTLNMIGWGGTATPVPDGNAPLGQGTLTIGPSGTVTLSSTNAFGTNGSGAYLAAVINGGRMMMTYSNTGGSFYGMGRVTNLTMTAGTISGYYAGGGLAYLSQIQVTGDVTTGTASVPSVIGPNSLALMAASGATNFNVPAGGAATDLLITSSIFDSPAGGANGIVKNGDGIMVLSGPDSGGGNQSSSTFSGDITVNHGKLVGAALSNGGNQSVFGAWSSTRTITVNPGATLEFDTYRVFGQPNSTTVPAFVINNGTVTNGPPGASYLDNPLNNVTLSGGTLTSTSGRAPSLAGSGAWDLNGTVTSHGNSLITTTLTNTNGQILLSAVPGNSYTTNFNVADGVLTVSTALLNGVGTSTVSGLTKTGTGVLALTASNAYTGNTTVSAGAVEASDGIGLPSASFLVLDGGVLQTVGSATITRDTSPTAAAGLMQWTANGGGFAARGGKLTVNLAGAGDTYPWSTPGNGLTGTLEFGSPTADSQVEFVNPLNLNGADRTVNVSDNPASTGDYATLSGRLSNTSGTAGLIKTGSGTLELSASNSYNGGTTVNAGTLKISTADSLPTGNNLTIASGGHVTLASGLSHAISLGGLTITSGAGVGQASPLVQNPGQAGSLTYAASPAAPTPEPGAFALLAAGILAGMAAGRMRRMKGK